MTAPADLWRKETVPTTAPDEAELALWRTPGAPSDVLCLHGISAQHRAFNALARVFSGAEVSLAALDLRGRGDSEKPASGYGLETHARDTVRALDALGVRRAVLCGHSMGAFVALRVALDHPERVRALVLLDGGWPRAGDPEDVPEEEQKAIQEGLARAFSRLDRVFETPEAYLDFWFPGQGLTFSDLPEDLADYYRYDLERVEGGYSPKTLRAAAEEDSEAVAAESPTAEEMRAVAVPVALVRAGQGFFPGSDALVSDEARDVLAHSLDLRREVSLPDATHYTMMFGEPVARWSGLVLDAGWAD
ncbi:putative hydrolases or acyltransferases (alpha/beta hydrolase superfamily) [Rubrobacter radiotolerans]|uniref:Alpha/beta fold hydrolase n=1 Tax=Rubrobacter radiotolerans TaxID=42256 RepID=A0A023X5N9_RUBRA|nr:alpha/beta fold hydrolase [Rubrobacter radiotolerans]AHY47792.1 putative hydrolases or acyltransferases (alpha/beta hydrolase superfamily) [Rubrobacter radiotolerans]MDX5892431.1 alpha/beta fold hydrolase [Rubrobacter radiotolerans]SMC07722.1 Pimeloyl-ACP methyl ester carboxylesterase [Rubrobacter radiotolerans DSM 5868]